MCKETMTVLRRCFLTAVFALMLATLAGAQGTLKTGQLLGGLAGDWKGMLTYVEGDSSGKKGDVPARAEIRLSSDRTRLVLKLGYPQPVTDTITLAVTAQGKIWRSDERGTRLCTARGLESFPKTGTFSFEERIGGRLSRVTVTRKKGMLSLVNTEGVDEARLAYARSWTLERTR
jgi:hypothetical protein